MEEEQKKNGVRTHLLRVLRGMAGADSADHPNFQKFQQFFSKQANITDDFVDLFLEEFLFKLQTLPAEEAERKHILLAPVEASIFNNDTTFVKKIINRTVCSTHNKENKGKVLTSIGQKFNKMRTTSKFVEYLMRAVETNQVVFLLEPQLRECLGESFLKMPLSQSLTMGMSMCDIIYSEHEQRKTDVKGMLNSIFSKTSVT